MANKSLSIRIDSEMLHKLHVVADYGVRSANSQILILIRECIEKYEENTERYRLINLLFCPAIITPALSALQNRADKAGVLNFLRLAAVRASARKHEAEQQYRID